MRLLFTISGLLSLFPLALFGAGISGTWSIQSVDGDGRPVKGEITFVEEGGAWKATLSAGQERKVVDKVQLESDRVSFEMPWEDQTVKVRLEMTGDALKGRWTTSDADGTITGARLGGGLGGVWKLSAVRPNGSTSEAEMELKQEGGEWKGVMRSTEGSLALQQLAVAADQVSFQAETSRGLVKIQMKLQEGMLKGTWSTVDSISGAIEGRR
jgi:hypothetical protein